MLLLGIWQSHCLKKKHGTWDTHKIQSQDLPGVTFLTRPKDIKLHPMIISSHSKLCILRAC